MTCVPPDPLQGVRIKIERAKTHLSELEGECQAFKDSGPYQIVRDAQTKPGKLLFRVKFVKPIPADWSAIIGDVIHNLRSALDLLATALVIANGGTGKGVYFPFARDPTELKTKVLKKRMPGASDKALQFVERLKPHEGGNVTLWAIHQLDILDKHRAIIPVGAAHVNVAPDWRAIHPGMPEQLYEFAKNIALRPADRQYPLRDGAVLFECPIPKPGERQPEPRFTINIAFGEGQIVDGQPIIVTLKEFAQTVDDIVRVATTEFFSRKDCILERLPEANGRS